MHRERRLDTAAAADLAYQTPVPHAAAVVPILIRREMKRGGAADRDVGAVFGVRRPALLGVHVEEADVFV